MATESLLCCSSHSLLLPQEGFTEFQTLARFSLGSSTTSMSFSRSSFSPSLHPETNQWHFKIELVVSTSDNTIRILSSTGSEEMMTLGSTESKCNDVSWSEAEGYENFIAAAGGESERGEKGSTNYCPHLTSFLFRRSMPLYLETSFPSSRFRRRPPSIRNDSDLVFITSYFGFFSSFYGISASGFRLHWSHSID